MKTPLAGFRFSIADAVILAAGAAGAYAMLRAELPIWWLLPMVVGHFFLFCNVFRVRRAYELAWAAAFILNVGFWLSRGTAEWIAPTLTQIPFTVAAIIAEMRSPRYHGILANHINPRLGEYIQARLEGRNL